MNIARIMIPKFSTVFLHEKDTVQQGLERFMVHGYTDIPVLNEVDGRGVLCGILTRKNMIEYLAENRK